MRVQFQPCQALDLGDDPAGFLSAADLVRQRKSLAALGEHPDGVDGIVRVAALLQTSDRDNGSDVGELSLLGRADPEHAVARHNFSIADEDSHAAESYVKKPIGYKEIPEDKKGSKEQGSPGVE